MTTQATPFTEPTTLCAGTCSYKHMSSRDMLTWQWGAPCRQAVTAATALSWITTCTTSPLLSPESRKGARVLRGCPSCRKSRHWRGRLGIPAAQRRRPEPTCSKQRNTASAAVPFTSIMHRWSVWDPCGCRTKSSWAVPLLLRAATECCAEIGWLSQKAKLRLECCMLRSAQHFAHTSPAVSTTCTASRHDQQIWPCSPTLTTRVVTAAKLLQLVGA